jgi:hypothetical protein
VVVALMIVAAACGGGGKGLSQLAKGSSGAPASNAGVTLTPPNGWTVKQTSSPVGIVIAEQAADIDANTPSGPRLIAQPVTSAASAGDELLRHLDTSALVGSPETSETTVDGKSAVEVSFTVSTDGKAQATRVVTVALARGKAYTFTLRVPQEKFAEAASTMDAVLATVHFDVANVPAAP